MVNARREDGAITAEYVALLFLVAGLVLALLLSGISPAIADGARRALCLIFTNGPCPAGPADPIEPEELNRMGLPCLTRRNTRDTGFSVLVKGVQWDRGAGYAIEQLGTGTFRVTLYGQDAIGVGTLFGDGPGSVGRRSDGSYGWITGRYGAGSLTTGGRTSSSYDFATREEAEAFAESQRGGYRHYLHVAGGTPSHMITQGYEHIRRNILGHDEHEPRQSFTSTHVNLLQASGRYGYNAGWAGVRGSAGASTSGVLTQIHLNGWSVFTSSFDASAGVGLSLAGASGFGGGGVAMRYRVIFDEHGEPLRLVLVNEYGGTIGAGAEVGGVGQRRPGGRFGGGGGAGHSRSFSQVHIEEVNLDLRDPENRAAFEEVFDYVPHLIAVPKPLNPVNTPFNPNNPYNPHNPDNRADRWEDRWDDRTQDQRELIDGVDVLGERLRADGVVVDLTYEEAAPSVGGGTVVVGRGLTGFLAGEERVSRELATATILDPRWEDPEPRHFADCWSQQGGFGVPSGAGSPGDGPGL